MNLFSLCKQTGDFKWSSIFQQNKQSPSEYYETYIKAIKLCSFTYSQQRFICNKMRFHLSFRTFFLLLHTEKLIMSNEKFHVQYHLIVVTERNQR